MLRLEARSSSISEAFYVARNTGIAVFVIATYFGYLGIPALSAIEAIAAHATGKHFENRKAR